jgi:hypothetical protein
MIPRQKALASTAAGSHHLINFDADSAGHVARPKARFHFALPQVPRMIKMIFYF